jgi:hypothetical protein
MPQASKYAENTEVGMTEIDALGPNLEEGPE